MATRRGSPRSLVAAVLILLAGVAALAENIDPLADGSQFAWGENVGWLNAEPSGDGGPGVHVVDSDLTGYMWGENVGWISLSCEDTASCANDSYGVQNDGCGTLTGYAWGENVGWISFSCVNTASCATSDYGATIDPQTGEFSGRAWGENVGWITFASSGANPYTVKTSWQRAAPTGVPSFVRLVRDATTLELEWSSVRGADSYQLIQGSLGDLVNSAGDFTAATGSCSAYAGQTTVLPLNGGPDEYFLVRAANCGGKGTVGSGGSGQIGLRDSEVTASGNDCP